jgi:N-acetylneuraminic acid mutarotase
VTVKQYTEEVTSCVNCPNHEQSFGRLEHEHRCGATIVRRGNHRMIHGEDRFSFPKWCPLETAEEIDIPF